MGFAIDGMQINFVKNYEITVMHFLLTMAKASSHNEWHEKN